MITNIDELKSEILRREIAKEEDLIGCEDRELESIEQRYGKLPLAYKQIMKLLGKGGGKWLSEGDFALAGAIGLSKWMREDNFLIDDRTGATISQLENVFFISGRYAVMSGGIEFIKTGEDVFDSYVYNMDMAYSYDIDEWIDTIEIYKKSIFDWIQIDLDIAEQRMLKAKAKANRSFWQVLFDKE
jgi:hypothetical protein